MSLYLSMSFLFEWWGPIDPRTRELLLVESRASSSFLFVGILVLSEPLKSCLLANRWELESIATGDLTCSASPLEPGLLPCFTLEPLTGVRLPVEFWCSCSLDFFELLRKICSACCGLLAIMMLAFLPSMTDEQLYYVSVTIKYYFQN